MRPSRVLAALSLLLAAGAAAAQAPAHGLAMHGLAMHGLAMHGAPALPADFAHLPYADPAAPQGGRIALGVTGGFDSLNPLVLKGRAPAEIRAHTFESLMARSWDEPFTLYGLIAESVATPEDRAWVEFTLREGARFSDGAPVEVADVLWSMRTLAEVGRPNFKAIWDKVAQAEQTGPRSVRFTLNQPDREAPLILGLVPILRRGQALAEPGMTPLIGSGPYVIESVEAGRTLTLARDPDWWGRDLPVNRGLNNLDRIAVEYFLDAGAHFDAFKAGAVDLWREADPVRWAQGYGFARMTEGRAARAEIAHRRPSGMYGFVFNARRPPFDDIRVRRALTLAFNFEWINATLFGGAYARIGAYFDNSPLRHVGAAQGAELALLAPFAASLPAGALDAAWSPPVADARDARNRRNLREAARLLEAAGWTVRDGALRDAAGRPFAFEILLGAAAEERLAGPFREALATLGIEATVRTVDSAQLQERRNGYDYDMTVNRWGLSLSPGAEQRLNWGGAAASAPGARNYAGVDSPAVDAAIDALLTAADPADFAAAVRALDRVLSHGAYVIPFWHDPVSRIAHDSALGFPARLPLYGDFVGWAPDVWWRRP